MTPGERLGASGPNIAESASLKGNYIPKCHIPSSTYPFFLDGNLLEQGIDRLVD